jgi:DNA-binding transcriptional ArsR family regulator
MLSYPDTVASRTATDLVHPNRGDLVLARVLGALGDPVRLGVVARLAEAEPDGELACGTITTPVSKSTQSAHFKILREAGVIHQRDQGTRRLNRLRRDDLNARFPGLLDLAITHGRDILAGWTSQPHPTEKPVRPTTAKNDESSPPSASWV